MKLQFSDAFVNRQHSQITMKSKRSFDFNFILLLLFLLCGEGNCWFGGGGETKILLQDVKVSVHCAVSITVLIQ